MIYQFNSFWSYIGNETPDVMQQIKNLLTRQEWNANGELQQSKFYVVHNNIFGHETIKIPSGLCKYVSANLHIEIEHKKAFYEEYSKKDILAIAQKVRDYFPNFEVRDYQMDLTLASVDKYSSMIVSSVGSGKTSVMTMLAMLWNKKRILVTNNQNFILRQIYDRFIDMGISKDDISTGTTDLSKRIVIISSQTSYNRIKEQNQEYLDYLKTVDVIINDEMQHFQSISCFSLLFYTTNLQHLVGYSGSPFRNPDDPYSNTTDMMTIGIFGEPAITYTMNNSIEEGNIAQPYVYYVNYKANPIYCSDDTDYFIQYKKSVVFNQARNKAGIEIIKYLNKNNIKTLVLFREVKRHGLPIMKQLKSEGVDALFLQGGDKIHEYDAKLKLHSKKGTVDDIKDALNKNYNIVFASQVMDEGVDITSFQAGVLFTGGKSPIKITQQAGRVSRRKATGENIALIVDFNDRDVSPLFHKQYLFRKKVLKDQGVIELENVYKLFDLVERMK